MTSSSPVRQFRPSAPARVELVQSNSRFIGSIAPADSVQEARAFIDRIRREMPDATHHVYAFRVGHGSSVTDGMSDDGEPSGTSGPPALAVLRGSGLGDVVLVITRYYGGTKLGTGGLVSAYGDTARNAVEAVPREEKIDRVSLKIEIPYSLFDRSKRKLEELGALVEREEFGASVQLYFALPVSETANFEQFMRDISAGEVTPKPAE